MRIVSVSSCNSAVKGDEGESNADLFFNADDLDGGDNDSNESGMIVLGSENTEMSGADSMSADVIIDSPDSTSDSGREDLTAGSSSKECPKDGERGMHEDYRGVRDGEPVASSEPVEIDQSVGSGGSVPIGEPVGSGGSVPIGEPVGSGGPSEIGEPVGSGGPAEIGEPVGSGEALVIGQQAEITPSREPVKTSQPAFNGGDTSLSKSLYTSSAEVEAIGMYSAKPCSSSSSAAKLAAPLPMNAPKVEAEDISVDHDAKAKQDSEQMNEHSSTEKSKKSQDEINLESESVKEVNESNNSGGDSEEVPIYNKTSSPGVLGHKPDPPEIITIEDDSPEKNSAQPISTQISCFNCRGPHNLRECTEYRNVHEINKRRREFNASKYRDGRPSHDHPGRYHQVPLGNFESQFRPGMISEGLRGALGLRNDELAPYIYNMRRYGYPPGHMQNAVEQTSGINFPGLNQGYYARDPSSGQFGPRYTFRPERLIEYPGYTTPVPAGFRDDSLRYGIAWSDQYSIPNLADRMSREIGPRLITRPNPPSSFNTYGRSSENGSCSSQVRLPGPNPGNVERNWYDGIFDSPNVSARPTSTSIHTSQRIQHAGAQSSEISRICEDVNLSTTAPRNYRMTQELERKLDRTHEEYKTKGWLRHPNPERTPSTRRRPSSPSLLDPVVPAFSFSATVGRSTSFSKSQKRPHTQVIEDDSDDSDVVILDDKEVLNEKPPAKKKKTVVETVDLSDDDAGGASNGSKVGYEKEVFVQNPRYHTGNSTGAPPCAAGSSAGIRQKNQSKTSSRINSAVNDAFEGGANDKVPVAEEEVIDISDSDSSSSSGRSNGILRPNIPFSEPRGTVRKHENEDVSVSSSDGSKAETRDRAHKSTPWKLLTADVLTKETDSDDDDSTTRRPVYSKLPPAANFSKGMPEMPLQDEANEYSGRFKKVDDDDGD